MNEELVNYISRGRGTGASDRELRQALLSVGWPEGEVEEALRVAGSHVAIFHQAKMTKPPVFAKRVAITSGQKTALITLMVLIAGFGVAVFGAIGYRQYQEVSGPGQAGERLVKNMADLPGLSYRGRLTSQLTTRYLVGHTGTSSVELPTAFGLATTTNQFDFGGSVFLPKGSRPKLALSGKWQTSAAGADLFHTDFSARLLDEVLYLNIADISKLPLFDLSDLTGRWLSITPAELVALGSEGSFSAITPAQVAAMRGAVAKSRPITITAKNGAVYDFTMSGDQVADALRAMGSLAGAEALTENSLWFKANNWQGASGQIWLGPNNLPKRIYLVAEFVSENNLGESTIGPVELDLYFDRFEADDIFAPDQAVSLLKLYGTGGL